MLRELFKQISIKDSPYKNIYYLTDTELRFSISDGRVISIRHEDNKYIVYGFEGNSTINRQQIQEIKTINEFWSWYNKFYNNF